MLDSELYAMLKADRQFPEPINDVIRRRLGMKPRGVKKGPKPKNKQK